MLRSACACECRGDFVYLRSDNLDLVGALIRSSNRCKIRSMQNADISAESISRGKGGHAEQQILPPTCNALKGCFVVSQGHRVSLDTCVALVRRLTPYKACEPVRIVEALAMEFP